MLSRQSEVPKNLLQLLPRINQRKMPAAVVCMRDSGKIQKSDRRGATRLRRMVWVTSGCG